jgi:hypothetical protein
MIHSHSNFREQQASRILLSTYFDTLLQAEGAKHC